MQGPPSGRGPDLTDEVARRTLDARVVVRRAGFTLDATVRAVPGEIVVVVGANGAGKSTLLHAVAGLVRPDEGTVRVGDRVLTGDRVLVPPAQRRIGFLGQDPLVFPHLDVRENVAFGPRAAGVHAARARAAADEWLARVGLTGFGSRRPHELSGGQRQRVALARALAAEPDVLLLDEPFAQVDVRTASAVRELVRAQVLATGTAAVVVTHDVVDVLTMGDRVVVLHDGAVVEQGVPRDVLTDPRHAFTAALAGTNLVVGTFERPPGSGGTLVVDDGPRIPLTADVETGARVRLTFPPAAVEVVPLDDVDHTWLAHVVDVEAGVGGARLRTSGDVLVDLDAGRAAVLRPLVGDRVRLRLRPQDARVRRSD
ncbi:ABC transporter ATP-binding protein [Cellulomonas sp. HZM]|uniref:ABC transporter ATP-binding protein n=1 Tax=Cellulomonas sp. HZM TaxID=1454010 RepID=UPI000B1E70AD|nr:ABC transporter ATP-binding protein [Cellulomonas sp. HZM]